MLKRLAARRHAYLVLISTVFFVVILIFLAILGAGCGKKTPAHGRITGIITSGRAGSAVAGATVTAVQVEDGSELASTITGSDGKYLLLVKPGTKVDLIATKEGYAGSRFQGILLSAGENFTANLIMQEPSISGEEITPPSLRITGVTPGQTIFGTLQISAKLEGGEFEPHILYIDIGAETSNYEFGFTGDSTSVALPTYWHPDGPSFIYIAAYDKNMNFVTTRIPVTVKNDSSSGDPIKMTKPLRIVAYTRGDDMHWETASVAWPGSLPNSHLHKNVIPPALKDVSTSAAEARSACYVELRWEGEFSAGSGFGGYNVYRSLFASGPWQRLGTAYEYAIYDEFGDVVEEGYYFVDTTPEITPGVRFYYKAVPYSSGGKEGSGQTQWVIPLGRFEVNLKAPTHKAGDVPLNPTLEWEDNGLEADYYLYGVELISLSEERKELAWVSVLNETSVVYDDTWNDYFDLQSNWSYQWDVYYAEAGKFYSYEKIGDDCVIYSMAVSLGHKGQHSGSYNGSFVFTTTGDEE